MGVSKEGGGRQGGVLGGEVGVIEMLMGKAEVSTLYSLR